MPDERRKTHIAETLLKKDLGGAMGVEKRSELRYRQTKTGIGISAFTTSSRTDPPGYSYF